MSCYLSNIIYFVAETFDKIRIMQSDADTGGSQLKEDFQRFVAHLISVVNETKEQAELNIMNY